MAYTVTQLINGAYWESSIIAKEFEDIQGYQLNDALGYLNQILQDKTANAGEIPYITTYYEFNLNAGQEQYYIPNLVDIQSVTFFIDAVRYEMKYVGRKKYFGTPRANNINALPLSYGWERAFGGVNIFLYFFPQEPYLLQIVGNTYMNPVTLNQDLTLCQANLGNYTLTGTAPFILTQGNLVVNGIDLQESYSTIAALVAQVNAIVPQVVAGLQGTQFVITATNLPNIQVTTLGTSSKINNITFQYFPTTAGMIQKNFTGLNQFYIDFLQYQLAARICTKLNFAIPPGVREQLDIYKQQIVKMAEPMDLQLQKTSALTRAIGINYAQANIGKGYTTNGGY